MGTLTADVGWGLLAVADRESDFRGLPDRMTGSFHYAEDCALISVRHVQDGPVTVGLWRGEDELDLADACAVGEFEIRLRSRHLVVGDILRDVAMHVVLADERHRVLIHVDDVLEATVVDLVLLEPGSR